MSNTAIGTHTNDGLGARVVVLPSVLTTPNFSSGVVASPEPRLSRRGCVATGLPSDGIASAARARLPPDGILEIAMPVC